VAAAVSGEDRGRLKGVDRVLGPITWIAAGALVVMLFVGPILIAEDEPAESAAAEKSYDGDEPDAAAEEESGGSAAAADGEALFAENCGSCHTLEAAGTSGAIGPNLDDADVDAEQVAEIVSNGQGSMPSFSGSLDEAEIEAVAQFVAGSSGS
jgi:mono/diheme cytochrome c family protein